MIVQSVESDWANKTRKTKKKVGNKGCIEKVQKKTVSVNKTCHIRRKNEKEIYKLGMKNNSFFFF